MSLHGAVPYSSPRGGVQIAWIVGSRTLRLLCRRRQLLRKAACRSRPSSNSFALLRSYRAPPNVWLSPRALAPRAPLLMTGSLLRALVTRNRWLLARPAARATGLAPPAGLRWFRAGRSRSFLERLSRRPAGARLVRQLAPLVSLRAGLRWYSACRSRSFLERACHADQLVLGSSGSSRHLSRSALVFAVCACCTTQSPGGSSVGLAPRWSPPLTSSVPLSPRAREFLEFGYSRQFHTRGCYSFDCPASPERRRPKCGRLGTPVEIPLLSSSSEDIGVGLNDCD